MKCYKFKITGNLKNLKDQESFCGLSVTEDYTLAKRQMIKDWPNKAKENKNKELPDSEYV